MINLEQLRATQALNATGFSRNDVAGFPALIMQNGMLAAFAYACEDGKTTRAGLKSACDATAKYITSRGIVTANNATALIAALAKEDSLTLQRATTEALAFFSYLKRFSEKEK